MKGAIVAALAVLILAAGAAQAQSTSKAKPINPLNPPRQAQTPSGFDLIQRPSNDAHNPNLDPAKKRRPKVLDGK